MTWRSTLLVSLALLSGFKAETQNSVGRRDVPSPPRGVATHDLELLNQRAQRPIRIRLWYLAGDCRPSQFLCPSAQAENRKVAILSHGALGSAEALSWLGSGLASRGWIVAGVSHFGESWVYGADTVEPDAVLRFWQRPEDISYALDELARSDPFGGRVEWKEVAAIGHSSGGQTVAALAGVLLSLDQLASYCASDDAIGDRGCFYSNGQLGTIGGLRQVVQSYADARVSAIVMLDPGLGPAATIESMQHVTVPALIIGARDNDFLPFGFHAERYARFISTAKLDVLQDDEGHFVFIDACDHNLEAQGIPLCRDRPGVDRERVHAVMLDRIAAFLTSL